jgi:hypothetical protein
MFVEIKTPQALDAPPVPTGRHMAQSNGKAGEGT